MRYNQIVRAKEGTQRHIQHVDEVRIPDLWHAYMAMMDGKPVTSEQAEMVLETWHLCHDLLKHIKRVCVEPKTDD